MHKLNAKHEKCWDKRNYFRSWPMAGEPMKKCSNLSKQLNYHNVVWMQKINLNCTHLFNPFCKWSWMLEPKKDYCKKIHNFSLLTTHWPVSMMNSNLNISVIIWTVGTCSASCIKWIFRTTAMPILENLSRVRSVHCTSRVNTFKLPLCFAWHYRE